MTHTSKVSPKILFVSGSAYPLGGLATWLDYLLPGLRRRGWDPVLGLVQGPRHHRPEAYLTKHPCDSWRAIPCTTGTPEGRCRAIVQAIEEEDADLVVGVNIPDAYYAVDRLRHAGNRRVRVLMTIHGILPQLFSDVQRFEPVLDGIAATNRLACNLALQLGAADPGRVWYAPYGMPVPNGSPTPVKPTDRWRVGYVGRLDQDQKRVLDLPKIAAKLDELGIDQEWRIAGNGPELAELRSSMDFFSAAFLGHVSHSDLAQQVYQVIDVLLVTSRWETGPMVIWEAMRQGVPVVTSRYVGSGRENALRHEENALVFPVGDVQAAAREIARLFAEPKLRARLREQGYNLIRQRYSQEVSVGAWDQCFQDVLSRPARTVDGKLEVPHAAGRLDRWMPPGIGDLLRNVLGRTMADSGPGGEWPHSYGGRLPLERFLRNVEKYDCVDKNVDEGINGRRD